MTALAPAPTLQVEDGPLLLDPRPAPSGRPPRLSLPELLALVESAGVLGRGGAGFPLARKLETAAAGRSRPVVVVNGAEGEPASAKDTALLTLYPHRVLDGAVVAARALGAKEIHVVTPADRPAVGAAVAVALGERDDRRLSWARHVAQPRFVAGQARAVLELLAGRDNLPVTSWAPEAVSGHRGRPTLLSNAETFAHLGAVVTDPSRYAALGTDTEPGTTLLTIDALRVVEVELGSAFGDVLDSDELDRPVLLGGYHGTWCPPGLLHRIPVSRIKLCENGIALGAGVVLPLPPGESVRERTAEITAYLADQSARRCGPCRLGLPALADAVRRHADGEDAAPRALELAAVVSGRGACAHPDGTARLVRSMLALEGRS